MMDETIRVGDDITISGTVEAVENGCVLMAVKGRDGVTRRHWINPDEIKAIRPGGKGGKGR